MLSFSGSPWLDAQGTWSGFAMGGNRGRAISATNVVHGPSHGMEKSMSLFHLQQPVPVCLRVCAVWARADAQGWFGSTLTTRRTNGAQSRGEQGMAKEAKQQITETRIAQQWLKPATGPPSDVCPHPSCTRQGDVYPWLCVCCTEMG